MIRIFRYVALVEGVTTLALFLVAMPLKYLAGNPVLVPPVGLAHGVAFLAYLLAMAVLLPGRGLSWWQWLRTFVAAFLPFGTFLNDPMLKRRQREVAAMAGARSAAA